VSGQLVRDATVGDASGIAHVHTRTWQGAYDHVFPTERLAGIVEQQRAEQWRERLSNPGPRTHTLVVEGDDGIVGFASVGPSRDTEASRSSSASSTRSMSFPSRGAAASGAR
jgi:hypothetical protein